MEASYTIICRGSEYRIILNPVNQVSGVSNMPVRLDNYIDGYGYSIFLHFIARDKDIDIVELLKDEILEVSGK